jgi:glutathione S-transferase
MNPHGRVPVIDDAGTAVWESHAILRCLAARYAGSACWPDDPARRSLADRWMDWAQTSLQPDRSIMRASAKIENCARHMRLPDQVLAETRFIAGDAMTLADIAVGTHLYRHFNIDIDRPDVPRLSANYDRLGDRPAYRKFVMLPFGEMYGRTEY